MPVIVVGADTDEGATIIRALEEPGREIRAFVSDARAADGLRSRRIKVALGDVSDDSHVEAAATGCFTAVLVGKAADDARERSFASSPRQVLEGWARAVAAGKVTRVIWVTDGATPDTTVGEVAVVSPSEPGYAQRVVELDNSQTITSRRPGKSSSSTERM